MRLSSFPENIPDSPVANLSMSAYEYRQNVKTLAHYDQSQDRKQSCTGPSMGIFGLRSPGFGSHIITFTIRVRLSAVDDPYPPLRLTI